MTEEIGVLDGHQLHEIPYRKLESVRYRTICPYPVSQSRTMLDETIVRNLCETASRESDAQKAAELLAHLRDLIKMESDETRLRVRQILLYYRNNFAIAPVVVEKPHNSMSSLVAALVAGMRQGPPQGN